MCRIFVNPDAISFKQHTLPGSKVREKSKVIASITLPSSAQDAVLLGWLSVFSLVRLLGATVGLGTFLLLLLLLLLHLLLPVLALTIGLVHFKVCGSKGDGGRCAPKHGEDGFLEEE
jgi:hypothetical protein